MGVSRGVKGEGGVEEYKGGVCLAEYKGEGGVEEYKGGVCVGEYKGEGGRRGV